MFSLFFFNKKRVVHVNDAELKYLLVSLKRGFHEKLLKDSFLDYHQTSQMLPLLTNSTKKLYVILYFWDM